MRYLAILLLITLASCEVRTAITYEGTYVSSELVEKENEPSYIIVVIEVLDGFNQEPYKVVLRASPTFGWLQRNYERLWGIWYLEQNGHLSPGDYVTVEIHQLEEA